MMNIKNQGICLPTNDTVVDKNNPIVQKTYQQVITLLNNNKKSALSSVHIPSLCSLSGAFFQPRQHNTTPNPITGTASSNFTLTENISRLEQEYGIGISNNLNNGNVGNNIPEDALLQAEKELLFELTNILLPGQNRSSNDHPFPRAILELGNEIPRRVCQHPFRKNDIVWVCRTCQSDETCVLCHDCYKRSDHEGHDVAFYHAQAGGCCDCGDPDAWDPRGFCDRHGKVRGSGSIGIDVQARAYGLVLAICDWSVGCLSNVREWEEDERSSNNSNSLASCESNDDSAMDTTPTVSEFSNSVIMQDVDSAPTLEDLWRMSHRQQEHEPYQIQQRIRRNNNHSNIPTRKPPVSQIIGEAGRNESGLFLTLTSDDIHTASEIAFCIQHLYQGFSRETYLSKIIRLLRFHGDLILFGTAEITSEVGNVLSSLWIDGDVIANQRIGEKILEKQAILKRAGLISRIVTRRDLEYQQRIIVLIHFLSQISISCDLLCEIVAECLDSEKHLKPLLLLDLRLGRKMTQCWHALLLTLLAIPNFKANLAGAYCDTYKQVTKEYAKGVGVLDCSLFTLSVQFLNRKTYVRELAKERLLLERLVTSLHQILKMSQQTTVISISSNLSPSTSNTNIQLTVLNPIHPILSHRRYSPCISDLKCVLNVQGMSRRFTCNANKECLRTWIDVLSITQGMDFQIWRSLHMGHVETEPRGWVGAFNASISLGSLFERILAWDDVDDKTDEDTGMDGSTLLSMVEVTLEVMVQGLCNWQKTNMTSSSLFQPTFNKSTVPPYSRAPASLPMTTISCRYGSPNYALKCLSISQSHPWSFHYPLHRFSAACLREVMTKEKDALHVLLHMLQTSLTLSEKELLYEGIIEYPLLVLSRSAQIRAGLWKRNGSGMQDQLLNYAEPPFCRSLRDADLLLVQYGLLDYNLSNFVNLCVHRFGLFDFCGLAKMPNKDMNGYLRQIMELKMYPSELGSGTTNPIGLWNEKSSSVGNEYFPLTLPWTYSPASRENILSALILLEELFLMWIILITELPSSVPSSYEKNSTTQRAKQRLRREVVHRLASGARTHSELAEVHHVLPQRDNLYLSAEGKEISPDDATGAALEEILIQVADFKKNKGSLSAGNSNALSGSGSNHGGGPNTWVLKKECWNEYDPAFFHLSLRNHECAADNRPKCANGSSIPYAPMLFPCHEQFKVLRKKLVSDAMVVALVYRTLHVHLHKGVPSLADVRGKEAYEKEFMSEAVLARAVHLLTLGFYSFKSSSEEEMESAGSIYFNGTNEIVKPNLELWVKKIFLREPEEIMDCAWYKGAEKGFVLIRSLAHEGGIPNRESNNGNISGFTVQDSCLVAGAKWIYDQIMKVCPDAEAICFGSKALGYTKDEYNKSPNLNEKGKEIDDKERRKQEAKKRAMQAMQANAAKFFASIAELDDSYMTENGDPPPSETNSIKSPANQDEISPMDVENDEMICDNEAESTSGTSSISGTQPQANRVKLHPRAEFLLKERPQCIICCVDDDMSFQPNVMNSNNSSAPLDGSSEWNDSMDDLKPQNLPPTLAFCGYAQASTVLKGGLTTTNLLNRFVGVHVTLCGHAVHTSCCDSYLSSINQRDNSLDNISTNTKKGEFRCPLCQRLSNILIPYLDVGTEWIETSTRNEGTSLKSWLKQSNWLKPSGLLNSQHVEDQEYSATQIDKVAAVKKSSSSKRSFLNKKEIMSAWNNVMKTTNVPKFRKSSRTASVSLSSEVNSADVLKKESISGTSNAIAEVFKKLMDTLSDVSHRADWKRLGGEDELIKDYGEFRHYFVEKALCNKVLPHGVNNSMVDWPLCISKLLSDSQRNDLLREKLLSKLFQSIQSFTYTCCAESFQIKKKNQEQFSKFGIEEICNSNTIIMLPAPKADDSVYGGRIGKLRYFAFSIVAACSTISTVIIPLVFNLHTNEFSLNKRSTLDSNNAVVQLNRKRRAPIVYPILIGHVLTHVVAGLFAVCGKARFSTTSSSSTLIEVVGSDGNCSGTCEQVIVEDCDNFIKLGFIARILQVLIGSLLQFDESNLNGEITKEIQKKREQEKILELIQILSDSRPDIKSSSFCQEKDSTEWCRGCYDLLQMTLTTYARFAFNFNVDSKIFNIEQKKSFCMKFKEACNAVKVASILYLSDISLIYQIIFPGIINHEDRKKAVTNLTGEESTLQVLMNWLRIESLNEIVGVTNSSKLTEITSTWFEDAFSRRPFNIASRMTPSPQSYDHFLLYGDDQVSDKEKNFPYYNPFDCVRRFPVFDWPLLSSTFLPQHTSGNMTQKASSANIFYPMRALSDSSRPNITKKKKNYWPMFSSKKFVPLLSDYFFPHDNIARMICNEQAEVGGKEFEDISNISAGYDAHSFSNVSFTSPRISLLPTSYTDLYAELSLLYPDSEQTALCLVCGEVLNAGGKGECTKHAVKCGAGCGIFFLLQECLGLIMHGGKAAYVHSPYVDSYGETPQYRGRPLNLDLDRYDMLHEMWSGHLVREKVIAERSSSRQVIIANFY